jgi:hypothetical protein
MRATGSNDIIVDNVFVPFDESPNMAETPSMLSRRCIWSRMPASRSGSAAARWTLSRS